MALLRSAKRSKTKALARCRFAKQGNAKAKLRGAYHSKAKAWQPVGFGPFGMSLYIVK